MWLVHLSPGRLKRDVVVYVSPESPSAENGPQGGGRQAERTAQWPYTPSGVQGAPHPA
ncbi:hypothetical protein EC2854350_1844 [Escherichia coli 2854350]|nr:hypothetical protein [Escherichia coli]END41640.1 hypothetical protein EC2854350_1844 [Escherichia coli 2854350]